MFSATSRWGNSAADWNTIDRSRWAAGRAVTSVPPMRIRPALTRSRPAANRRAVDFPAPDGPSTQTISPSATARSSAASAVTAP